MYDIIDFLEANWAAFIAHMEEKGYSESDCEKLIKRLKDEEN